MPEASKGEISEHELHTNPDRVFSLFKNSLEAIEQGYLDPISNSNLLFKYILVYKGFNNPDGQSMLLECLNSNKSKLPKKIYQELWEQIRE